MTFAQKILSKYGMTDESYATVVKIENELLEISVSRVYTHRYTTFFKFYDGSIAIKSVNGFSVL